jgi:hypothetical protein
MKNFSFPVKPGGLGIVSVLTGYLRFIFRMACGFSATGVGGSVLAWKPRLP